MEGKKGGLRGSLNKVVLAYSGGLDTSVIVPCCGEHEISSLRILNVAASSGTATDLFFLFCCCRENYGCEVVCFTADVGQVLRLLQNELCVQFIERTFSELEKLLKISTSLVWFSLWENCI